MIRKQPVCNVDLDHFDSTTEETFGRNDDFSSSVCYLCDWRSQASALRSKLLLRTLSFSVFFVGVGSLMFPQGRLTYSAGKRFMYTLLSESCEPLVQYWMSPSKYGSWEWPFLGQLGIEHTAQKVIPLITGCDIKFLSLEWQSYRNCLLSKQEVFTGLVRPGTRLPSIQLWILVHLSPEISVKKIDLHLHKTDWFS